MLYRKVLSVAPGLLVIASFVMGACQPQVIEVEKEVVVTQVVREEVEVQVEVEKVIEVEKVVEKIVEVEVEVPAAEVVPVAGQCCEPYRIGIFEDPLTTNYWSYLGPDNSVWTGYIMGGGAGSLYALSDQRFDFVPSLAKGLPPEPVAKGDLYTITVEMVNDAVWSDGEPLTAHDVVFTVQTVLDLQLTGNWPSVYRPESIDHVEAVDDYIVEFFFTDVPGLAVWQYAAAQGPILPQHFWGDIVAEARSFVDGLQAPEAEMPEDCEAEGLSDDDKTACESWAAYDESFENARKTLYEVDVENVPVAGGYTTEKFEPGAFVERVANDRTYFAGAEIVEYDDGTWVLNLPNGESYQLYGNATGEETLRLTSGPYSSQVVLSIYGSQDAAFLALADGEIDYVLNPLSLARGLREQALSLGGVTTYTNADNGLFYLAFNLRKEPMSHPEFRQAFDILIDKEFVADSVLQGTVLPTYSVVPAGNAFWFNPDIETPWVGVSREERLNAAVKLLKEAGWSWGVEPTWNEDHVDVDPGEGLRMPNGELVPELTILGPGPAYDPQRAVFNQWISEWGRELGVPVQSELTGFNTILTPVFVEASFDMYILGWGLTIYPDYLVDFFHSKNDTATSGNYNTPGLNDADFDAAGDAFIAETDITRAQEQANELQVILANERPYIPLFNRQAIDLIRTNVQLPYTESLGGLSEVDGGFQTDAQVLSE